MNKIVASLGMVALGASSYTTASAQDVGAPPHKFWNVTATLRGFYDDNINGAPSGTNKVDSFGFEISPGIGLNWTTDQTTVKAGYAYSLRYFDKERFNNEGHDSQSHTFDLSLDHRFNERYSIGAKDSFVIGQEPDLLRSQYGGLPIGPVPGDNIRNYGEVVVDGALTPVFGFQLGYDNQLFDYDDHDGSASAPSLSGLLDRIEQSVHIDGTWRVLPETTALLGYQLGWISYTADETIGFPGDNFVTSSDKNSRSHYVYAGLNQRFSPELNGSIKAGGRFTEFYNENPDSHTDASPYVQASLRYTYAPESYLEGGVSYDLTMVDISQARDAKTANIYATLRHRIVPNLFGSLTGLFQHSTYSGGGSGIDGESFELYTFGANLEYQFNYYLSAHVGYNFDAVSTDVGSDYQRNRVYIGLTASY